MLLSQMPESFVTSQMLVRMVSFSRSLSKDNSRSARDRVGITGENPGHLLPHAGVVRSGGAPIKDFFYSLGARSQLTRTHAPACDLQRRARR